MITCIMTGLPYCKLPELSIAEPQLGCLLLLFSRLELPAWVRPSEHVILLGVKGNDVSEHEMILEEGVFSYSIRVLIGEQIWSVRPIDILTYQNQDGEKRMWCWNKDLSRKLFREVKRMETK